MEKIGNSNLLRRILVLVLCLALGVNMLPGNNVSVKVEAADIPDYSMYIQRDAGLVKLNREESYSYTGLNETTGLFIESETGSGGSHRAPKVTDVTGATKLEITWTVGAEGKVIKIENTASNSPEATIRRVGPGVASVTCNLIWTNASNMVLESLRITSSIAIPADINKKVSDDTDGTTGRSPFTKYDENISDAGNTALMFNVKQNDIVTDASGKKVILSYGTKSTSNSVNWKTENTSIATITRTPVGVDNEDIKIIPHYAGTTLITASSAISEDISDSFYAVVMPTFTFGSETNRKSIPAGNPASPNLSNLITVNVDGGTYIQTNALKTRDLRWRVYQFTNSAFTNETDLLKIDTRESSDAYIASNPKAGIYRITAQTKVPGKDNVINKNLGVAEMYAKVPIKFPNGHNIVLGLSDTYNVMDNSNIQSVSDFEFNASTDDNSNDIIGVDATTKNVNGKAIGLATATFNLKNDASVYEKYGIQYGSADYNKYVRDGIKFSFSVVDSFGINNSNIKIPVKGTADLTVYSQSNNNISWTSSNSSIVEVTNAQGKTATVTGKSVGSATVTVTQIVNGVKKVATCTVTVVKSAETIVIKPSTVDMNVNETKMITAKLTPDDIIIGNLKWSSSDEKVVKIDSYSGPNAILKGIGDGTAIITVINTENSIIATCKVTVRGTATGVTVTPAASTVDLSQGTLQLKATVQPASGVQPLLNWISSDTDIATVNGEGLVTLKAAGDVKITASVKNTDVSGFATIKIKRSVQGIDLEASNKVMYTGEKYTLGYTISPADASNKKVIWTSSKPSVATVDSNGNVLGVSAGETIIMAQTEDGRYTDYCTISVKQVAKSIKITNKDVFINKGDVYKIEYTVDPGNATDISVKWETLNASIATVSQDGKITAVAIGSTTILGKTSNGEIAYCNVTVIEKAKGIKLNYDEKIVYKNNTFALKASIDPEGATNRKVIFTSSKPTVATVSSTGTVKGISPGTALITVTADDGGYKAICVVIVKEMVTTIKLNHTFYAVGIKNTFTLVPKVTSTNTTNKKVSFSSSNSSVAVVNSKGQVTGRKLGYATITVRALDGSGVKATCRVRVVVPTKSLKLNRTIMTMVVGRSTKLVPTFSPKNTSYKTVKWTSSNSKVARVLSDGTITALSPGTATITASSKDSGGKKKAVCYVTVREAVPSNGITITSKNPVMVVGEKFTLSSVLTPYNSTDSVTWESDNKAIATIGRTTGTITAKTAGTATIVAISSGGKTNTTTVTVVGLDVKNITLEQYTNFTLSVIGAPTGVTWYSENPSVATVQNGRILTRSVGRTRIVAVVRGRRLYCNLKVTSIR
ncbi:uncharacterized protein YjdB [Mobilisporobacter senegalensis]|uniref:Uncharacterized protein YjdB n=1 Tax=Mobilisporobacter senegalensis TaxID=1329262 RepID=A0A3N1XK51_9FIRM|nr:Ig-like domain-containing protein [Mobilisporobacter senegalensis]ROR27110.1 uncharacterized protein YjdB [Mobilisporobacter senegalensis]